MPERGFTTDIYITANSPGEIAGWVVPVIREIRARLKNSRITLVIVPCQYASGAELSYGRTSGADRCVRVGELGKLWRETKKESPQRARVKTLVLHLGGDFFFSRYVSHKVKGPLWAYASRPRSVGSVKFFFVPDEHAAQRFALLNVPADKFAKVGHLALDSVVVTETEEETREFLGLGPDEPVLTFLSGSRPVEYMEGVPYFAGIASKILDVLPEYRVYFPMAPTVDEELLQRGLSKAGIKWRGQTRVHEIELPNGRIASVVRDRTLEVLNCSKLAVAVPGTNNLQAAALFIPFIMVLPLDRAEQYPLDGLPGVIPLWVPGYKRLKKNYIMKLNEKTRYVCLPNRMAGRMIVPEIRGIFAPDVVVKKAVELLQSESELQRISREFWELTHERGASVRIAEKIADWAKGVE